MSNERRCKAFVAAFGDQGIQDIDLLTKFIGNSKEQAILLKEMACQLKEEKRTNAILNRHHDELHLAYEELTSDHKHIADEYEKLSAEHEKLRKLYEREIKKRPARCKHTVVHCQHGNVVPCQALPQETTVWFLEHYSSHRQLE